MAEYRDFGGRMQSKVFKYIHFTMFFMILDGKSVSELTCFRGFEADDKGFSGESVHISRAIIGVLILVCDCHCISPAHIQTNSTT